MTDEERKELQKELQRVVCAANRFPDGTMLIGARHWDTHMVEQAKQLGIRGGKEKQGFVDQFGNFLTREEAWKVARNNQQIIRLCSSETLEDEEGYLFSENLY